MSGKLLAIALAVIVIVGIVTAAGSIITSQSEAREDDWFNTKSPSGKCYEVFQKSRGSVGYHFVMFEKPCS